MHILWQLFDAPNFFNIGKHLLFPMLEDNMDVLEGTFVIFRGAEY